MRRDGVSCPFCGGVDFQPASVIAPDLPKVRDLSTKRLRTAMRCRVYCRKCKALGPLEDDFESALTAMARRA